LAGARPYLAAVAALALLLGGCGGDDDGAGSTAAAKLMDRLPAEQEHPGVTLVDLDRAREALDLPSDADPREPSGRGPSALLTTAGAAIPYLASPYESPLAEAIDAGRIQAAASTAIDFGPRAVSVIATDQPFDEIASALEASGWQRDGDVLTLSEGGASARVGASAVAGRDGVVVLGYDPGLVGSAAGGDVDPGSGLDRELATESDAPAVATFALDGGCLTGLAVASELDGNAELTIVTDDPDPERLTIDEADSGILGRYEFEAPEVDGDRLRVRFKAPTEPYADPLAIVGGETTADQIYDCG
jgi:hypothetical protein